MYFWYIFVTPNIISLWQCNIGSVPLGNLCDTKLMFFVTYHSKPLCFWHIFVTIYIISLWWCKIGSDSFEESLWHNINALCDLQNPRDVFLVHIWDMNALYLCDKGKLQRSFLTLFVTSNFSSLWHKHFQAVILGYVCDTILFIFVTSKSWSFFRF